MRKFLVVFLILLTIPLLASDQKEKVSIQLKWFSSFQFAGYYMAKEKGFYDEAGFDVAIVERDPSKNNIEQVIQGVSEYGVADSAILLYRAKGQPVKILASIFQHSPLVYLAKKSSGIVSPLEMKGKKISFEKGLDDAPLAMLLRESKIKDSDYQYVPLDFSHKAFIEDKVDVISSYLSDEPYAMKELGIETNIINPLNYGIDFYGDNLFTTEKEIKKHPKRVSAFVSASIRGWKYALAHKEETIALLRSKYNAKSSVPHLEYEADITEKMIVPDMVEIGYTSTERFERIANMYQSLGVADKSHTEEALRELVYDPNKRSEALEEYFYLSLGVLSFLAITVVGLLVTRRHLKFLVKERTKEMQKLLNEQQALLQVQTAGFFHVRDRRFIWANSAFERILGYESGELVDKNTRIIYLNDDDYKSYGQKYQETLGSGRLYMGEILAAKKDGNPIWLLASLTPLEGLQSEAIGVVIDISRQKQLEFSLQELVSSETEKRLESERMLAQQAKLATLGEMIHNIAHQWRQPLNALAIMIQDIPEAVRYNEINEEYAAKLKHDSMNQINYMSQTIDDFRSFFKPDKEKTTFCVKDDVKRAYSLIKDGLSQAFISVDMELPPYRTLVYGYPNEFGQVILNILSNAKDILETRHKERWIKVSVSNENDYVKISICDNGGGIEDSTIDKIFEPYFTTKHQAQGTGLGLYMSKMIIEQNMGGKLTARNAEEGACFTVELPLA